MGAGAAVASQRKLKAQGTVHRYGRWFAVYSFRLDRIKGLSVLNKSFQTLGNTVQDRNGTKLDLKNCGQYGFLQQCLSFALPRSTWPF